MDSKKRLGIKRHILHIDHEINITGICLKKYLFLCFVITRKHV